MVPRPTWKSDISGPNGFCVCLTSPVSRGDRPEPKGHCWPRCRLVKQSPLSRGLERFEEVRARFEHWRSTRLKLGPIPQELWQAAVSLVFRNRRRTAVKILVYDGQGFGLCYSHQEKSQPVMDRLKGWLASQFEKKLVEANSTLGGAIQYMQNHWEELTLFLRAAGAPLDNKITERALKRAILHRKNSLFYKTEKDAVGGDIWMSLIHSAELAGATPFDYLVALQRYRSQVEESPADWMPWNYKEILARLLQH